MLKTVDTRILIIDDDPLMLRLLRKQLADAGYDVLSASNGQDALTILRRDGPQIIITDYLLPEIDGIELCRIIRDDEGIGTVYILMLTVDHKQATVKAAFEAGADDFLTKPFDPIELLARLHAGIRMLRVEHELARERQTVHKINAELAALNHKLERMATMDELTGLGNRREAVKRLAEVWANGSRQGLPLSCMLLDIDHFKRCNDTYGHEAGDLVLRETARILSQSARAGEVSFRLGGEEFLILCPGASSESAVIGAERIRRAVESNRIDYAGTELAVTVSVGVAERNEKTIGPDDLLKLADDALYAAKRGGRNRVCLSGRKDAGDARASAQPATMDAVGRDVKEPGKPARVQESVLVVDDDPDVRQLCCTLLAREGFQVHEAEDGREALIKLTSFHPSVIIMDVIMPNMDGLECTRLIKADPAVAEIPVIMVSAKTESKDIETGLAAGADEYITKPFKAKEFLLRVRSMDRLYRGRRDLQRSNEVRGEQARCMGVLFNLSRQLAGTATVDEVIHQSVTTTAELLGCRRVSLMVPDTENRNLIVAQTIGLDDEIAKRIRVPIGGAISGQVFVTGEPIVMNDTTSDLSSTSRYDSEFFASVPLVSKALNASGCIVGVLNLTERQNRRPFSDRELEYIDLICNMTAAQMEELTNRKARDEALDAIVVGLGTLAEYRDAGTGDHLTRVTRYALALAEELRLSPRYANRIDNEFLEHLRRAMPLHDIGKVGIPDAILLKPGKLSESEFALMKTHTTKGARAIRVVLDRAPAAGFLKMALDIARDHHEWYDGSGYPRRLKRNLIPLSARIAAVADVYDALTSERPYKKAFPHDKAVRMIREGGGRHFDPDVVNAFLNRSADFKKIANLHRDEQSVDAEGSGSELSMSPVGS